MTALLVIVNYMQRQFLERIIMCASFVLELKVFYEQKHNVQSLTNF